MGDFSVDVSPSRVDSHKFQEASTWTKMRNSKRVKRSLDTFLRCGNTQACSF